MSNKDRSTFKKLSKEEKEGRYDDNSPKSSTGMTIASRLVLFFILPLIVGSLGLITSHVQNLLGKEPVPMNFDRDFVYPFLITLVLVVIVSIQTGNFSTYQAKPLITWPKVVRKKKITRKTIVVDDDGNVIEDEDIRKSLKPAANKKDD